jgi:hypothetical protein
LVGRILNMDVLPYVVIGLIVIPMLVMALFLLNGKGASLLAGYNTMTAKEQALYDEKALCRSAGWLLIAISACTVPVLIGIAFGMMWLVSVAVVLIFVIIVGYLVYANTGNRFRKKETLNVLIVDKGHSPTGTSKRTLIAVAVISGVTCIAVMPMLFVGAKEPVVNVLDNGVQIEAMYGLTVDFSDITNISLVEASMDDLGVDDKTNGYALRGDLKGHFRSDSLGDILLFAQSKSSPTIRIERNGEEDIYLSFPDSEKTETLYRKLTEAFPSK